MRNSLKDQTFSLELLDSLYTNGAGFDVLRYISLPELLGDEANTLLYFMGRKLARKFNFKEIEDIHIAFEKLGWGKLELMKKKKKSITFSLMSDSVVHRLQAPISIDFRLEAGFLAEAIQMIENVATEANEKVNKRIHQIQFTVFFIN